MRNYKVVMAILAVLLLMTLTACGVPDASQRDGPPKMTITAGGEKIESLFWPDTYNGDGDAENAYLSIAKDKSLEALSIVPFDTVVELSLNNIQPDKAELTCCLLDDMGTIKNEEEIASVVPITFTDGGYFTILSLFHDHHVLS